MRLLVIGGTKFLGRAVVDAALARGHEVTLFNRGQRDPGAYPSLSHIRGDRMTAEGLSQLKGQRWDAAIDTAAYLPKNVRELADVIGGSVDHYTFVSSVDVITDNPERVYDENAAVARLTDEEKVEVAGKQWPSTLMARVLGPFYAPLKVLCEEEALSAFAGRALVARSGLLVGPFDLSDRFTYWPVRLLRGGDVLAPGKPQSRVQFVDVRDLAEWLVRSVEAKATGTFNVDGPAQPPTFGELLAACAEVAKSRGAPPARFVWVDDAFLVEHEVQPFRELPLWSPDEDAFRVIDSDKARAAGLTYRPLEETVRATLEWEASRPPPTPDAPRLAGMTPERERALLEEWAKRAR